MKNLQLLLYYVMVLKNCNNWRTHSHTLYFSTATTSPKQRNCTFLTPTHSPSLSLDRFIIIFCIPSPQTRTVSTILTGSAMLSQRMYHPQIPPPTKELLHKPSPFAIQGEISPYNHSNALNLPSWPPSNQSSLCCLDDCPREKNWFPVRTQNNKIPRPPLTGRFCTIFLSFIYTPPASQS